MVNRKLTVLQDRQCGGCSACCVFPGIKALNKPVGVPCQYLGDGFCTIYHQQRPDVCGEFRCLWIQGYGIPDSRPDRCGVLLTGSVNVPEQGYKLAIIATELWPGALEHFPGNEVVAFFAQHFLVFSHPLEDDGSLGESVIDGPEDRVAQLKGFHEVRSYYTSGW